MGDQFPSRETWWNVVMISLCYQLFIIINVTLIIKKYTERGAAAVKIRSGQIRKSGKVVKKSRIHAYLLMNNFDAGMFPVEKAFAEFP